jgi:hypothetical protein
MGVRCRAGRGFAAVLWGLPAVARWVHRARIRPAPALLGRMKPAPTVITWRGRSIKHPNRPTGRTTSPGYLTGPAAITLHEAAQIMADRTGRAVRYEPETVEQAYASRASYGAPQWQLDAWVSTYTAIANGELEMVSDAVERLTGRPPLSLATVLSGIGSPGSPTESTDRIRH